MGRSLNGPLITAICIGVVLVLVVCLFWIWRWASRKPSYALPPPRPTFVSPYRPQSSYYGTSTFEEPKLGSPYYGGTPSASGSSQVSLWRPGFDNGELNTSRGTLAKLPPGARPSAYIDGSRGPSSVSLTSSPLQTDVTAMLNGDPSSPPSPLIPPEKLSTEGGHQPQSSTSTGSAEAAAIKTAFPSQEFGELPIPPYARQARPLSSASQSRPSLYQRSASGSKADNRMSRMSMYSIASVGQSSLYAPDGRRMSTIRGAPHKNNIQIVLPQPLAPTALSQTDEAYNRSQRRLSRVDMWTETNTARNRDSYMSVSTAAGASQRERSTSRPRRKSQGSDRTSKSLEIPFVHAGPPPPLPGSTIPSRAGTPNSLLFPPSPTAATTPNPTLTHLPDAPPQLDPIKPLSDANEIVLNDELPARAETTSLHAAETPASVTVSAS